MLIYLCDCCHAEVTSDAGLGHAYFSLRMPELSTMTAPAAKRLGLDRTSIDYLYSMGTGGQLCVDCLLSITEGVRDAIRAVAKKRRKPRATR